MATVVLSAYFAQNGSPTTGLSPTIDIWSIAGNTKTVTAAAMTELGGGFYNYTFGSYDNTKDYNTIADSVTLFGIERYAIGTMSNNLLTEVMELDEDNNDVTLKEQLNINHSVLSGKSGGGGTNNLFFRDRADSKDRLTERVTKRGDRSGVTLDGT